MLGPRLLLRRRAHTQENTLPARQVGHVLGGAERASNLLGRLDPPQLYDPGACLFHGVREYFCGMRLGLGPDDGRILFVL